MNELTTTRNDVERLETEATALFHRIIAFNHQHGGKQCYVNWPGGVMEQYVRFMMAQNTFTWVQTRGQIAGTAVAWQGRYADVKARADKGEVIFHWQPTDPEGDCVFVAEVVTTEPAAMGCLIASLTARFPHWKNLRIVTMRDNKLVNYTKRVLELIIGTKGKG
jgi:hypothetical protein